MKKLLVGTLGAVITAIVVWVILVFALGMETGVLQFAIAGFITALGFALAQGIYEKTRKK